MKMNINGFYSHKLSNASLPPLPFRTLEFVAVYTNVHHRNTTVLL